MSSIRYKKRGDRYYVYELTHHWDKVQKKSRQKAIYLGCADEVNGSYSKKEKSTSRSKIEKAILDFGDTFVLKEIAKDLGLE